MEEGPSIKLAFDCGYGYAHEGYVMERER